MSNPRRKLIPKPAAKLDSAMAPTTKTVKTTKTHHPEGSYGGLGSYGGGGDNSNEFPVDLLPAVARDMSKAIMDAEKIPASLAATCVLGAISGALGRGLRVQSSSSDRTTPGNLYFIATAESGSGKSRAYKHALRPLFKKEQETQIQWEEEVFPRARAELQALNVEYDEARKKLKNKESDRDSVVKEMARLEKLQDKARLQTVAPHFTVDDATMEALGVDLQREETIFHTSPDARNVVDNLLGKQTKGDIDDSLFLKGYDGEGCKVRRVSRPPVCLGSPIISILWLIQPDKLDRILGADGLIEGGFLARALLCHTHTRPRFETGDEGYVPSEVSDRWGATICDLLTFRYPVEVDEWGESKTKGSYIIKSDPEAIEFIRSYQNEIASRQGGDLHDVRQFAARLAENAWRVALNLHAAEHRLDVINRSLSIDTARQAIGIIRWFTEQQLAILSGGRQKKQRDLIEKIRDRLKGRDEHSATLRILEKNHGINPDVVRALAKAHPSLLHVEELQNPRGGPRSWVASIPKT